MNAVGSTSFLPAVLVNCKNHKFSAWSDIPLLLNVVDDRFPNKVALYFNIFAQGYKLFAIAFELT